MPTDPQNKNNFSAINYHLSQTDPLRRRQTILKLGIDPNEILSAGEVWSGIYKPLEIENKENKMNVEALESDKVFIFMHIRYLLWEIYCID